MVRPNVALREKSCGNYIIGIESDGLPILLKGLIPLLQFHERIAAIPMSNAVRRNAQQGAVDLNCFLKFLQIQQ